MELLTRTELRDVRDAALAAGLGDPTIRAILLDGIMPMYSESLPRLAMPRAQLTSDLQRMNGVGRLTDGTTPLEVWLDNAVDQVSEAEPFAVLQRAHDKVAAKGAGEPEVPDEQLVDVPEAIVHQDDTVPYGFLRQGVEAGAAVARLRVPQFSVGQPRMIKNLDAPAHFGTAWLVTPALLMTNHHVIAARESYERDTVSDDDLKLQAARALAEFDFDSETGQTHPLACSELVAWDPALDYAVVRLAAPCDRRPLRLAAELITLADGDQLPVNIIQHPNGDPKRVALRNNLVDKATERDLRYFTDTRQGSSGSPVLDDEWGVVALHRASRRIAAVNFQGKDTAVVNVGTQIHAVLADLEQRFPTVHQEITL